MSSVIDVRDISFFKRIMTNKLSTTRVNIKLGAFGYKWVFASMADELSIHMQNDGDVKIILPFSIRVEQGNICKTARYDFATTISDKYMRAEDMLFNTSIRAERRIKKFMLEDFSMGLSDTFINEWNGAIIPILGFLYKTEKKLPSLYHIKNHFDFNRYTFPCECRSDNFPFLRHYITTCDSFYECIVEDQRISFIFKVTVFGKDTYAITLKYDDHRYIYDTSSDFHKRMQLAARMI